MVTNPMLDPVQRLLLSEASVRALTESRLHAFLLLTPRGEILGCNGLAQEMAQRHFARPLATGEILDFPFDEAQRAEFRRRLRETLKGRAGSSRFSVPLADPLLPPRHYHLEYTPARLPDAPGTQAVLLVATETEGPADPSSSDPGTHLRHLVRLLSDALYILDGEDRVLECEAGRETPLFAPAEESLGHPLSLTFPPDLVPLLEGLTRDCRSQGRVASLEVPCRVGNSDRICRLLVSPYEGSCVLVKVRDLTDHARTREQLNATETLLGEIEEAALMLDPQGGILSVNPAMLRQGGYAREDLLGLPGGSLLVEEPGSPGAAFLENALEENRFWEGEVRIRRKDGSSFPQRLRVRALLGDGGEVRGYLAVGTDLSIQKEQEARLAWQVYHDGLTGLPNRHLFLDRLNLELQRTRRTGHALGVLLLDLNRFRDLNALLGHREGDRILALAVRRIQENLRSVDTVARLEGNTFGLVVGDAADPASLGALADRILASFRVPLDYGPQGLVVGVSLGVALHPGDGEKAEELLDKATQALRKAKGDGGCRCVFYDKGLHHRFAKRILLENGLRRAIQEGHLRLHYQPLVRPASGKVVAVEALLRWPTGKGTFVPPGEFLPVAEETGLMVPLGEWVFREACAQAARWASGPVGPLPVSVNLSGSELRHGQPLRTIREALASSGLDPRLLGVEICENALLEEKDAAEALFRELRSLGVRVYIDDFGTGYSSLAYLRDFSLDGLKVDKSFVTRLPGDGKDLALVSAIREMARALGLDTVVEGIETPEQNQAVQGLGYTCIQGFLYSRAQSPEALETLLTRPFR